jgi:dTMP kinase
VEGTFGAEPLGTIERVEGEGVDVDGAADTGAPRYFAFEGAEGCGKSTQAARLAATLDAVLTRETGGTDIGARLRAILHDNTNAHLDDRAEALLAAADRAQHLAEVVRPALDAGRIVVSDRSAYSSLAYQGHGRELDVADIAKLNDWATAGRWPDLVIFLDTPDDVIAERMSRRALDRFESEGGAFHQRVLDGYRTMAAADPDRWITVQAIGSIDRVAGQIRAALEEHGVTIDG